MRSVLTPQAGLQTLPQPRHRLSYGFPALPKAPSRAKHVPCAESSFSLPSSREEAVCKPLGMELCCIPALLTDRGHPCRLNKR